MAKQDKYKKALIQLIKDIIGFGVLFQEEMDRPTSFNRGRRYAVIMNWLTYQTQSIMHSALGYDFDQIDRIYNLTDAEKSEIKRIIDYEINQVRDILGKEKVVLK